jgi:protoheme IX farnesyltransferase
LNIQDQIQAKTTTIEYSKMNDYSLLIKTKLSLTVVITSLLGYLIVAKGSFNLTTLTLLFFGGFLTTASANAINEVLEKDFDALMNRTLSRPLAAGRMKISEAVLFAGIACLFGISFLAMINPLSAILGMISFIVYSFVYTPLKRYSTIAVAIGAIPGALPVLIGCTAFEGQFSILSIGLFLIQFIWQFPHFWSIGFLGFDDYKKAGYKLLPIEENGSIARNLGINCVFYTLLIFPILGIIYFYYDSSNVAFLGGLLMTMLYTYFGYEFSKKFDRSSAMKLMFCSFFYMPIILLFYLMF